LVKEKYGENEYGSDDYPIDKNDFVDLLYIIL
jgi:hypothetical protein